MDPSAIYQEIYVKQPVPKELQSTQSQGHRSRLTSVSGGSEALRESLEVERPITSLSKASSLTATGGNQPVSLATENCKRNYFRQLSTSDLGRSHVSHWSFCCRRHSDASVFSKIHLT